jgi:Transposase IS200 like
LEKVCADFEAQLAEMNGEAEHVHLLVNYPPKRSVSSLANSPPPPSFSTILYWPRVSPIMDGFGILSVGVAQSQRIAVS